MSSALPLTGPGKVRQTQQWLQPLFNWLDALVTILNWLVGNSWSPVDVMTATALPANTYNGTTKTKTADSNGRLRVDNVYLNVGQTFWDNSAVTGSQRGKFRVTDAGSATTPWKAIRTADANSSGAFTLGRKVYVIGGDTLAGVVAQLSNTTFTLDTTTPVLLAVQQAQAATPLQALTGAGVVDVISRTTRVTTATASDAVTLAAGLFDGQRKSIVLGVQTTAADAVVITPVVLADGTTVTLQNALDSVELEWSAGGNAWFVVNLGGTAVVA